MATRVITIHDRCTTPGCGRVLHSISEAERGTCSSCWISQMKPDTKIAMSKLVASAFNGSTEAQKKKAVDDALGKMKRDESLGF